jgi:hypothetical protein
MSKVSSGNYRRSWIGAIIVAGLLALLTAGCGTSSTLVKNGDRLRVRDGLLASFNHYWTVRAGGEPQATFKLEAPYVREMASFNRYRLYLRALGRKARLMDVEVLDLRCEQPFYCTVSCRLVYEAADGRKEERKLRDHWVLAAGRWSHVLRNPMFFPELGKAGGAGGAGRS